MGRVRFQRRIKAGPVASAEPEYEGPLDLVPGAVVAYGVRALSAAMLGQNIFRLRRDSDDAESNFVADAVTGDAPVVAIATWLGEANSFVVTWYDQSGNGKNATQADTAKQPSFVLSLQGGRPGFAFTNFAHIMQSAEGINLLGEVTYSAVRKGDARTYLEHAGNEFSNLRTAASGSLSVDDGANLSRAIYSGLDMTTFHVYSGATGGATHILLIDGSLQTPDSTNNDTVGAVNGYAFFVDSATGDSRHCEEIVYPSLLSNSYKTALQANQDAYFVL